VDTLSEYIATSYRLDGPGSISRYFQFFIAIVFLYLTSLCINVFAFCMFCIAVMHSVFCTVYVCITVYVPFIVYVILPPGISQIAVGNKYNIIYNIIYNKVNCRQDIKKEQGIKVQIR
jgi:hypothetical protein